MAHKHVEEAVVVEREIVQPSPVPRIIFFIVVFLSFMSLLVTLIAERDRNNDLEEQRERDRIFAEALDERTTRLDDLQKQAEEDRIELRNLVLALLTEPDPDKRRTILERFVQENGGTLGAPSSSQGGSSDPSPSAARTGREDSPRNGSGSGPSGNGGGGGGNEEPPQENPSSPEPEPEPSPTRPPGPLSPVQQTVCELTGICTQAASLTLLMIPSSLR